MKKLTYLFFIFCWLIGCEFDVNIDEDSLAYVCVQGVNDFKHHCGTGFFINSNKLITARHIIDNRVNGYWHISVVRDGKVIVLREANAIREIKEFDLSLIEVKNFDSKSYLEICNRDYLWDKVFVASFVDHELEISTGIIYRINSNWISHTTRTTFGWSGSPVISEDEGCVKGVLKRGMDGVSNGPGVLPINMLIDGDSGGFGYNNLNYRER